MKKKKRKENSRAQRINEIIECLCRIEIKEPESCRMEAELQWGGKKITRRQLAWTDAASAPDEVDITQCEYTDFIILCIDIERNRLIACSRFSVEQIRASLLFARVPFSVYGCVLVFVRRPNRPRARSFSAIFCVPFCSSNRKRSQQSTDVRGHVVIEWLDSKLIHASNRKSSANAAKRTFSR